MNLTSIAAGLRWSVKGLQNADCGLRWTVLHVNSH